MPRSWSAGPRRIPEPERPRWEQEWQAELASKPGKLVKLVWALWHLPLLWGSGEMGRLLGSPPVSEVARARLRAAWQRLRSRPKAPAQEPGPEAVVVRQVGLSAVLAPEAQMVLGGNTGLHPSRRSRRRDSIPPRSHQEFIAWLAEQRQELEDNLAHQRQEFEDNLDRRVKEYERRLLDGSSGRELRP